MTGRRDAATSAATGRRDTATSAVTGRRGLAAAVSGGSLGALVALLAASRGWDATLTPRPAPLGPAREILTGSQYAPWLPAVALVALAGTGAIVATRGAARAAAGGVLAAAGLGVTAAAATALGSVSVARWPALCLLGGLVVTAAGALALWRGRRWPVMGGRFDRVRSRTPGAARAAVRSTAGSFLSAAEWWDALDHGEDPTLERHPPRQDDPDHRADHDKTAG